MPRKVTIPFAFGRADRVDPKFAPLGTLAVAKNLRVRKDGRLASRTGYQPLTMFDQAGSTMVAFDLFEFSNGRLCALGASNLEGYPVDVYEYRALPSAAPWRSSDETGTARLTVTPFTYPRQVCAVPQPAGGVSFADCASGDGYVATVYKAANATFVSIQIVRQSDDQVVFARSASGQSWTRARVAYADGHFFFLGFSSSASAFQLGRFTPTTSSSITTLGTVQAAASATDTVEINAIANPSTGTIITIHAPFSGSATVTIKRWTSAGAQDGTTLTIAGVSDPAYLDIEADTVDNTVNVLTGSSGGTVTLRTYNYSNALLDGPTACTSGTFPRLCRLPARTAFNEHVAVAVDTGSGAGQGITIQYIDQDAHTVSSTTVISGARIASRMVAASSVKQTTGVVIGGFNAVSSTPTNSLWYASATMVHQFTRDLRNSGSRSQQNFSYLGLSKDTSLGRIAWTSLFKTGINIESFSITTLDVNTAKRRQVASASGITYMSGAPVQVYDGRQVTECSFNEVPSIRSTAGNTGGSLASSATYSYVLVFEYTLPDGTFFESPPSAPVSITTSALQTKVDLVVCGPHSERVALGDAAYGAGISGVLYRTVWDAVNGSQGSEFKEAVRFSVPCTLADYGDDISVSDGTSDANVATRATLYTQGGPVENNAPEGGAYISASSARISVGGLARSSEMQESKEQELDEGVNFSGLSSFFSRSPAPINGLLSLDGIRLVFSRSDIFTISGEGPQNDASGALPQPVKLDSPGGLLDWRSLLNGPDGVWFQLDSTKLYRTPRGSGAPEWKGVDVQDTIASFPVITGTARHRADDVLLFACQDTEAGTAARILARSLRTELWLEDTPPTQASRGIEALSSFGDSAAYVSGGVVYQQHATSFADVSSTVITTQWKTHPIYPFEVGGNGQMLDLQMTGEFRSAGDLALRVSYDDGVSFTTYDTFTISGLTVGATVKKRWSIQQSDLQSAVFELTFTPSAAGEGLIINAITLLVDAAEGLEDLDPADMA